jgi:protein tyrosine phosphatase
LHVGWLLLFLHFKQKPLNKKTTQIDDDPKNASYIASQGPLMHTTNDFWHMVWQEESVVIVSLCRTIEYGSAKCHQFWPANGFSVYDKFEVEFNF